MQRKIKQSLISSKSSKHKTINKLQQNSAESKPNRARLQKRKSTKMIPEHERVFKYHIKNTLNQQETLLSLGFLGYSCTTIQAMTQYSKIYAQFADQQGKMTQNGFKGLVSTARNSAHMLNYTLINELLSKGKIDTKLQQQHSNTIPLDDPSKIQSILNFMNAFN